MPQILTKYNYHLDLLEDLLTKPRRRQPTQTILLVCSSRADFFSHLSQQILHLHAQTTAANQHEIPASQESVDIEDTAAGPGAGAGVGAEGEVEVQHALLRPTLRLLATAQHVKLVFCDSVSVLRAYLAGGLIGVETENSESGRRTDMYVVDAIALHHGTSEFTLQGLSRSLAAVVSAAYHENVNLKMVECRDIQDETNPYRGSRLWNAEVPMLSGSIKIRQEGARWSGRSITIRKIVSRWFNFEKDVVARSRGLDEDEEMLI